VNSFGAELKESLEAASQEVFGKPCVYFGMGGSIPFIELLGNMYPKCVLLVTGVLGPGSNAHGPDENLDIKYLQ
jgi:acetylornithine deacetylase/succinyl-diaminopimelate desuccinylase-like protein